MCRRSDKQATTVKSRQRRLYDQILTKHTGCILMNEERTSIRTLRRPEDLNFIMQKSAWVWWTSKSKNREVPREVPHLVGYLYLWTKNNPLHH